MNTHDLSKFALLGTPTASSCHTHTSDFLYRAKTEAAETVLIVELYELGIHSTFEPQPASRLTNYFVAL
jgi:hypothetical protein